MLPGCVGMFTSVRDRAIDGCREKAMSDGWRVQGVEDVRREGTRSLVCYYDPATSRATLN